MEVNGTILARRTIPRTLESGKIMWRQIYEAPRYEISEHGQVRVNTDQVRNPGRILSRHWEHGAEYISEKAYPNFNEPAASLCVYFYYDRGRHKVRRIWRLMDKYWHDVEYPVHWKSGDSPTNRRPDLDKRGKLTWEQRQEIKYSDKMPCELASIYPVGRRYISQLKHGK